MINIPETRPREQISYKRFPWTNKTCRLLIDSFANKIDIFLDPTRTQAGAWKYVVSNMKKELEGEEGFDEDIRNVLTPSRAASKFYALKKCFKKFYFDLLKSDDEKQRCFPYYDKMNALFTDYATRHLNTTCSTGNSSSFNYESIHNTTTDADLTNYIVQLLNDEDQDKTSITILQSEEQENISDHASSLKGISVSQSQADKMRLKLSELPSDAIYISREKLKIDPNTPFSRKINNSTIMHQRSLMLHNSQSSSTMKRKLVSELEPLAKEGKRKQHINAHSSKATEDISESEYFIEKLDECELSDISMRRSKAIYHDSSPDLSSHHASPIDHTYDESSGINTFDRTKEKVIVESVIDIPPFPAFENSDSVFDASIDLPRRESLSETIKGIPSKEIIPKKLNIQNASRESNSTSAFTLMNVTSQHQDDSTPPAWFRDFLVQYNSDVKRIDDKLDRVLSNRNNSRSPPVLMHPKVSKIKLERM